MQSKETKATKGRTRFNCCGTVFEGTHAEMQDAAIGHKCATVESKGRPKTAKAYSQHFFSCEQCDLDSATSYPTIESAQRAAFAHNRNVHGSRCPRSPMHSKHGGDCWLCCPETE